MHNSFSRGLFVCNLLYLPETYAAFYLSSYQKTLRCQERFIIFLIKKALVEFNIVENENKIHYLFASFVYNRNALRDAGCSTQNTSKYLK